MSGDLQTCDLCGASGPDVESGFLRVVRQAVMPGVVASRWVNLRCRCCNRCLWSAQEIKTRRYLVVAAMLVWLFFSPCLLAPLGMILKPEEKGSVKNIAVVGGAVAVVVAGFLAGPVYLRSFNRRRTARLLGPAIDPELRSLAGIRSWGLLSEVLIVRQLPPGESWVPLGAVRSSPPGTTPGAGPEPDLFSLSSERFPWSITWQEGALVCRGCGAAYEGADHLCVRPRAEQWAAFWEALEGLGAWSWKGDYSFTERIKILGGSPWTLAVRRGDRAMECRGNAANPDANPPGFGRLVEAVLQLFGDATIESTVVRTFVGQKLKS